MNECGAPNTPIYIQNGKIVCRCMICAHCGHHTGNSTQGHYWAFCDVSHRTEEFHFCCPGNCEIYGGK